MGNGFCRPVRAAGYITKLAAVLTTLLVATQTAAAQQPHAVTPECALGAATPQQFHPFLRTPGRRAAPEIPAWQLELPPTIPGGMRPPPKQYPVAGYVAPAPDGIANWLAWQAASDGRWVCAVELFSANAAGLRVQLRGSLRNLRIRVYDPASGAAFGPYRPLPDETGRWWTTLIFGPQIGIELIAPPSVVPPDLPQVSSIAYLFEVPGGIAGDCAQIDVCERPAYADEADAVCMLAFIDADGLVAGFCSGALLWRQPADAAPLVMTAEHCVETQTEAGSTVCIWGYQFPAGCDGPLPDPNTLPRSDGSLVLKHSTGTDWSLLGLFDPPGATHYLGWWTGYWDDGSPAVGIHHPHGGRKRISFGTKVDETNITHCDDPEKGTNCRDAEVWVIDFAEGSTQHGSSGSPILDGARLVRGTCTSGPDQPCDITRYGRLDLAYVILRYYLGDAYIASPVHVHGGFPGDPGNNGISEQGTAALPFNTVYEATFAVRGGDTVRVYPGSYAEQFRLWRPLRIERWGDSGVVRIGD